MKPEFTDRIFTINKERDFENCALEIFRYQADKNPVYRQFIKELSAETETIDSAGKIPFLPIEFFKNHRIVTSNRPAEMIFESSGTTGSSVSRHYVADKGIYEKSFLASFRMFYGDPAGYFIAALLPSYTERKNSSLVYMAENLIRSSSYPASGFYNNNITDLLSNIKTARADGCKIILLGVSFALLDLAENHPTDLSGAIVMETGGMKGMRKEITRGELHSILKKSFSLSEIHSEYGMTELLSQSWSKRDGIYYCPPWMKILIRDPQDPLTIINEPGVAGGINIIDLANIHSCSFIATGDLGRLHDDGGFEVLGRLDSSDIRGCNLMLF
jgi:phenylacetate-coenzyme A ligase PaaK-like adenylate-forming protein